MDGKWSADLVDEQKSSRFTKVSHFIVRYWSVQKICQGDTLKR